jgi:hypothetical protein
MLLLCVCEELQRPNEGDRPINMVVKKCKIWLRNSNTYICRNQYSRQCEFSPKCHLQDNVPSIGRSCHNHQQQSWLTLIISNPCSRQAIQLQQHRCHHQQHSSNQPQHHQQKMTHQQQHQQQIHLSSLPLPQLCSLSNSVWPPPAGKHHHISSRYNSNKQPATNNNNIVL